LQCRRNLGEKQPSKLGSTRARNGQTSFRLGKADRPKCSACFGRAELAPLHSELKIAAKKQEKQGSGDTSPQLLD